MQLNPRESFTIVRQIEDHTDSATYYVRAVIRNAKTDTLLDTIDLTDRGSRRFSKAYLIPADASGQGFYVSILTSVYTDSGYTAKSENYGDKMDVYLVQDRANMNLGGLGGGGSDIDYKRIQKMIDKALIDHKPEKVTITKVPEIIKVPVENKVVVQVPKIERVEVVKTVIVEKLLPQEKVDLSPIINKLDAVEGTVEKSGKYVDKCMKDMSKDVKEQIKNIEVTVPEMSMVVKPSATASPKNEVSPRVKNLMKKQ